jgi:hypothetical protein
MINEMNFRMSTTSQPANRPLPAETHRIVQAITERELSLPSAIFLTSHRPLAFVLGQLLYVAAPMAGLIGWSGCNDWADILSDPDGPALLEQALGHGRE